MPSPALKFATVALNQFSKRVADFAKKKAKENEHIKRFLMKSVGWYHRRRIKAKEITPALEQYILDKSIESGSNLLGDVVVIGCVFGIYLMMEYRSSKNKEHEEHLKMEEMRRLKDLVVYQSTQIETLVVKVDEIDQFLNEPTMYSKTSERVVGEFDGAEKDTQYEKDS